VGAWAGGQGTPPRPAVGRFYDAGVEETCSVELRHSSAGAHYAALRAGDGSLVARSRSFPDRDVLSAEAARAELARALHVLGWDPSDERELVFRRAP
jgi:hypothetical protein